MVHTLTKHGHQVEFAFDGTTGTRAFAKARFDAVVCDMVMPEQEGVQTIRQMRAEQPDIAIVAISGGLSFSHSSKIDVLDIAKRLGADVTLKKPFQLSELVAAVDQALASRNSAQTAAQG
jgi:DNA-binding response OmpR family regulator